MSSVMQVGTPFPGEHRAIARYILNAAMLMSTSCTVHRICSGVEYLILNGVTTNVCVALTLRDAYFLDYWPILVADATNNAGPSFTRQATE